MSTSTAGAASVAEKRVVSNVFRGSVGNLIEWYDWYAYAAFSVYFSRTFFPAGDETAQFLNTAAVFAVGFLMRPLGGWLLGRFADRFGRRTALVLSVTMMATGSLLIMATPGYRTIGVAAPILLVLARLLQGLSVGGEYSTSATYLSEVASPGKRGFYSSFQYVTLAAGQLLALGLQIVLQAVLNEQQLYSWGWRIAFGVGAVAAVAVLYLRRSMDESESYRAERGDPEQAAGERGSLRELARHPREVLLVVGLTLGGTVAFYTYTTYMQKFMQQTSGIVTDTVTWINFSALLLFVLLQPLAGRLSDRIGRRPLLLFFGIAGSVLTVPLMTLIAHTRQPVLAFLLMTVALVIVTGYTSINAIVKAELFPTRIRALGLGLPYGLTVAIFGGTAELFAQALAQGGPRERLLLVRRGLHPHLADRLRLDAGELRHQRTGTGTDEMRGPMRVLLVEDDDGVAEVLEEFLQELGHTVIRVVRGAEALRRHHDADLVLLDLGLPDLDGQDVLRLIREVSRIGVLVLTARGDDRSVVRALHLGADDYLVKPVRLEVLLARMEAVYRRTHPAADPCDRTVTVDDVRIDLVAREVLVANRRVALTRKEFNVLATLAARVGTAVSRQLIRDEVWGDAHLTQSRALDTHVTQLRAKLRRPGLIATVHGYGYRLAAPDDSLGAAG